MIHLISSARVIYLTHHTLCSFKRHISVTHLCKSVYNLSVSDHIRSQQRESSTQLLCSHHHQQQQRPQHPPPPPPPHRRRRRRRGHHHHHHHLSCPLSRPCNVH